MADDVRVLGGGIADRSCLFHVRPRVLLSWISSIPQRGERNESKRTREGA